MTVEEMIEKLQEMPKGEKIYFDDSEGLKLVRWVAIRKKHLLTKHGFGDVDVIVIE